MPLTFLWHFVTATAFSRRQAASMLLWSGHWRARLPCEMSMSKKYLTWLVINNQCNLLCYSLLFLSQNISIVFGGQKFFLQITPLENILKNALLRCLIIFYYYKVEELHCWRLHPQASMCHVALYVNDAKLPWCKDTRTTWPGNPSCDCSAKLPGGTSGPIPISLLSVHSAQHERIRIFGNLNTIFHTYRNSHI